MMYCKEVPPFSKYFTKIRKRKILQKTPHLHSQICIRACNPDYFSAPWWGRAELLPQSWAPEGRSLELKMCWSSIHPCVSQIGGWEEVLTPGGLLFPLSIPFGIAPTGYGGSVWFSPGSAHNLKPISVSRGQVVFSWSSQKHWWCAHPCLFMTKIIFCLRERNQVGSLLSLLHCKVQRRNIKTLQFDGNGEYTFLFVSGVQSSLRKNKTKQRFIFQSQRKPWIRWYLLFRGKIRMSGLVDSGIL